VVIHDLTMRMTEYVVLQVLIHHRQQRYLWDCQQQRRWAPRPQWAASAIHVGIMGMGALGADAAQALQRLGFKVTGWSGRPKQIEGIECFSGAAKLPAFLQRTNILVCLLPLTPDTRHILNRQLFSLLNRDSPLGPPVLINAGRGGLQVQSDILDCLNDGTLGAASLDVFETEPLPQDDPLWQHPNAVITPHNAADTDPDAISRYVARQIERFESGEPLDNVVDLARGY
jgi:glyoxylate/hydroxypyruvate reductase A